MQLRMSKHSSLALVNKGTILNHQVLISNDIIKLEASIVRMILRELSRGGHGKRRCRDECTSIKSNQE